MRSRLPLAILLAGLTALAHPALAQENGAAKQKLDLALAVLRDHQSAAGKSCLSAMTQVHQTEDQVGTLGQQDSNTNHPDNGADVARDVLESDYETADSACLPDATRVCAAQPGGKACAKLNAAAGGAPSGP